MEPAPLKDPIFNNRESIVKSSSWTIWFTKLVAYIKNISANGVTSVTASSPVTSSGGLTPNIAIPAANSSNAGYLTSSDWSTFNGKLSGQMGSGNLLGRGSAGNGAVEEITLGTGLSFANTTLNSAVTSPGGNNTEIQYNSNGIFGASSKLVFNLTNNGLGIGIAPTDTVLNVRSGYPSHNIFKLTNYDGNMVFNIDNYGNASLTKSMNIYGTLKVANANIYDHNHTGGFGAAITESAMTLSDVTTNNASVSAHGFCPKLSANANDALRGDGTWGAVSSGSGMTFYGGASDTVYGDMTVIIGGNSANG